MEMEGFLKFESVRTYGPGEAATKIERNLHIMYRDNHDTGGGGGGGHTKDEI